MDSIANFLPREGWFILAGLALLFYFIKRWNAKMRELLTTNITNINVLGRQLEAAPSKTAKAVSSEVSQEQLRRIAELRAEREAVGWQLVAVQVRGMVDPHWKNRIPHASLWWNPATGEMKPVEEKYRHFTGKLERLSEVIGPARLTEFGAPPYKKLNDHEFVMLGVVYKAT